MTAVPTSSQMQKHLLTAVVAVLTTVMTMNRFHSAGLSGSSLDKVCLFVSSSSPTVKGDVNPGRCSGCMYLSTPLASVQVHIYTF